MPRSPFVRALSLGLMLFTVPDGGKALAAKPSANDARGFDLHLVVIVNDYATGLIAQFYRRPNGKLASAPPELLAVGLKAGAARVAADGLIDLDQLTRMTL